jgi:hypothetical protein
MGRNRTSGRRGRKSYAESAKGIPKKEERRKKKNKILKIYYLHTPDFGFIFGIFLRPLRPALCI